jgi:diadenosine tetraphosphate (Ap4A) HIT family hydrolase
MCVLCKKVDQSIIHDADYFIKEFKHSILIVGEHQFFRGYCQLVFKQHVPEVTDLDPSIQNEFFKELMICASAIKSAFQPVRMNYSSLGNVVPHIHFHLFPRYQEELDRQKKLDPWANADIFSKHKSNEDDLLVVKEKVMGFL